MTDHEIDALVTAANPLAEPALRALAIDERDLCEAILREEGSLAGAVPAGRDLRDSPLRGEDSPAATEPASDAGSSRLRGRAAARRSPARRSGRAVARSAAVARRSPARRSLLAGLVLAVLAVSALVALSGREPGDSGVAWAAPLVKLAESSPLLLLDRPGWHVTRADETDAVEGEMTFTRGDPLQPSTVAQDATVEDPADAARRARTADLHWRRGPLAQWQRDRAHSADLVVRRTILGAPAQISRYAGSTDFAAIWPEDGRVLEFRAVAADLPAFEALVGSLKRVDVDTWLSAMPASVVKAPDRGETIRRMLADVPLPPGFDVSKLEAEPTLIDRYQLGARVTGRVVCGWLARWVAARRDGDASRMREAVEAMRTSRRWKILLEMQRSGAWSDFVWETADAMRAGESHGPGGKGTIEQALGDGLGCGEP